MPKLRESIQNIYKLVCTRLYFGDETFFSGRANYDPVTLFGILTAILNGRMLVFGDYGSGKTTFCERISSLIKSVPLEFIQAATIHGHPEQTEEKIKATLDIGALEREGKEVVKWKITPFSPSTIIDEVNRLPPGKQNIILNEVDRGIWSYRGSTLFLSKKPLYSTVNYGDEGTTNMIQPLLDRFDVAVETGRLNPVRRRLVRMGINDGFLRDAELAKEIIKNILEMNDERAEKYVLNVSEEFGDLLRERLELEGFDVKIPNYRELEMIRKEVDRVKVNDNAELFLDYIGQEVYCQLTTRKDFSRCSSCHYSSFICSDLGCISGRAEKSVIDYAKALAWFEGVECGVEHIVAVMPYCIWHRCRLNPGRIIEIRDVEKDECDELFAVKECIQDVKRRWEELKDFQILAYRALQNKDYKTLEELTEKISHPFFKSVLKW